ncbi:MAG: DUF1571 domain-containing protein [Planctomycetaceae bacterium]|nr:DUF1571 domain-containing protein [Planctomycetaceae bacterium]
MWKPLGLIVLLAVTACMFALGTIHVFHAFTSNKVVADDQSPVVAVATPSAPLAGGTAPVASSTVSSPDSEKVAVTIELPELNPLLIDCYRNLERSIQKLRKIEGYTARWVRQIRKYGSVRDEEHVDIKIRHEPFGVHMNWLDGSQQVLFVEGQSDNKLLAHKSRGFASLRPVWRLPPDSRLAMKDSRYPVTQLGMLRLAERLKRVVAEFPVNGAVEAEITTSEFEGRPCIRQFVKFGSPVEQPDYALSDLLIDQDTYALVSITNHGWTEGGTGSEFVEHYRYENINWQAQLTDSDFDERNEAYPFAH